jgi:hypothetical protein
MVVAPSRRRAPGRSAGAQRPPKDPTAKDERPASVRSGIPASGSTTYYAVIGRPHLEAHGGRVPQGVPPRVCRRVLDLAAGAWHGWQLWEAGQIRCEGGTRSARPHGTTVRPRKPYARRRSVVITRDQWVTRPKPNRVTWRTFSQGCRHKESRVCRPRRASRSRSREPPRSWPGCCY